MQTAKRPNVEGIRWLTPAKADALIEKKAQAVLRISSRTFRENRAEGMYAKLDADQCPGIVELALIDAEEEPNAVAHKVKATKRRGSSR